MPSVHNEAVTVFWKNLEQKFQEVGEGMTDSNPVPSLLNLAIDRAAANIEKFPTFTFVPDHIVAILFEKTLEASKLNDAILKKFLETDNNWVRKRVKDLGIRPANRPVLPTSCSAKSPKIV